MCAREREREIVKEKDKKKPVVVFQAWNFRNFRKKDRQNRFQGEISKF